jgi:hypothetical protein
LLRITDIRIPLSLPKFPLTEASAQRDSDCSRTRSSPDEKQASNYRVNFLEKSPKRESKEVSPPGHHKEAKKVTFKKNLATFIRESLALDKKETQEEQKEKGQTQQPAKAKDH